MSKDISEKRLEEYEDVFADIFNNLVASGKKIVEEDELESLPTEAFTRNHDGSLRQGNRDVRKVDKKYNQYHLILGLENQQDLDNTMPVRTLGYDYATYEDQIQEIMKKNKADDNPAYTKRIHDSQKLAPAVTAVLYYGSEEWERPLTLHDVLDFSGDEEGVIRALVPDYPLNLIQLKTLPEEVRNQLTSDFWFVAEYVARSNHPKKLDELFADNMQIIKHPEALMDVLEAIASDTRFQKVKEMLTEKEREEGVTMCSALDRIENRGITIGVSAMIQDNLDMGIGKEEIISKLQKYLNITEEKATEYYNNYQS